MNRSRNRAGRVQAVIYRISLAVFASLLLLPAAAISPARAAKCEADGKGWVASGKACIAMKSNLPAGAQGVPDLVVFLHGDSGYGRKKGSLRRSYNAQFDQLRAMGIPTILLARPGYALPDGRKSGGIHGPNFDNYTPDIVDAIADTIVQIRQKYGVERIILFGHSGGAMISAIIAGKHPGVADSVVLVGFACNTAKWRGWRSQTANRSSRWPNSLSAHKYVDAVPTETKVRALIGARDRNTTVKLGKVCIDKLQESGVDAQLTVIPDADHTSATGKEDVTKAIAALVR